MSKLFKDASDSGVFLQSEFVQAVLDNGQCFLIFSPERFNQPDHETPGWVSPVGSLWPMIRIDSKTQSKKHLAVRQERIIWATSVTPDYYRFDFVYIQVDL